jgi:hypothetical protein
MTAISVIGDLHGYYQHYRQLLQADGLINSAAEWTGGDRQLWLIGDIFDRGSEGIECLALTMKLQAEAKQAGGLVQSLLGNHEMMLLCAYRMKRVSADLADRVKLQWLQWGGVERDLDLLTEEQADWLSALPAMQLLGDHLLIHADALVYITLGQTIEQVNKEFAKVLACQDLDDWITVLNGFSQHRAFSELDKTGIQRAKSILRCFGGMQLVHGHTPISEATSIPAAEVTEPWRYANDLCVNVDGGIYLGGPGFIYHL